MKQKEKIMSKVDQQDVWAELTALRSVVIGLIGKDKEGEYRPEFVERILAASKENADMRFTTSKDFLAQLKQA